MPQNTPASAEAALNNDEYDQALADRLNKLEAKIYPAGRPRIEAVATDGSGLKRDLGLRHAKWRFFKKASGNGAHRVADEAATFVAVHGPKHREHVVNPDHLVQIIFRPLGELNPVCVENYREHHKQALKISSRKMEYLEKSGLLNAYLMAVHPRICGRGQTIDVHVHLVGQLSPEHHNRVLEYLTQRFGHVTIQRVEDLESQPTIRGLFYYVDYIIGDQDLNEDIDGKFLLTLFTQTRGMKFSLPRGWFKKFRKERTRRAKRSRPARNKPPPRKEWSGSRVLARAQVRYDGVLRPSLLVETRDKPHYLLVCPAIPKTFPSSLSSLVSPPSKLRHLESSMPINLGAVCDSLQAISATNISYRLVTWPRGPDKSICDQSLALTVTAALLAPHGIPISIDPEPANVEPHFAIIVDAADARRGLALGQHLERVMTAARGDADEIVARVEWLGRIATSANIGDSTVDEIRRALVRATLRESGLVDTDLTQEACDQADNIANAFKPSAETAGSTPVRPATKNGKPKSAPSADAAAAQATPSATTDDQPVKPAADAKTAKPTVAPSAVAVAEMPAMPVKTDGQPVKPAAYVKTAKPAKPPAAEAYAATQATPPATTDDQPVKPAATTVATKMPRLEAPPTQPANPDTTDPDSADAMELSLAALANRPHMRADIDLWELPPLSASSRPYADLLLVKQNIEADYPDFRVRIWQFSSPIEPQFYVRLDGVNSPPERARWRRHIENMVAEKLLPPAEYNSNAERQFASLLEKDPSVEKWVKTKRGQFQIEYCPGKPYQPDFVVETKDRKLVVEVLARGKLDDPVVRAKAAAAKTWCTTANDLNSGKPWTYALVPDDLLARDVTLDGMITSL